MKIRNKTAVNGIRTWIKIEISMTPLTGVTGASNGLSFDTLPKLSPLVKLGQKGEDFFKFNHLSLRLEPQETFPNSFETNVF